MGTTLVTGGAGFIGSNFVRLLLAETTDRVLVVDALTYAGSQESLKDVAGSPRYAFARVDIADRDAIRRVFREAQPTAVVNFAAESHVDRSIDDPLAFVHTNLLGSFELLEAARLQLGGRSEAERAAFRFLHVSTDEVYGSLGATGAFHEATSYAPNSPYAATKAGADHLARAWHRTYGLPVIVTNCSNNYGPFQFPEKLIPLMILNAVEGRPLPIYGDGGNVRDWIHVEDHCRGVLEALRSGRPGERYNLGADGERSNLEVVDAICAALDELRPPAQDPALASRGLTSYSQLKAFVEDRPGHDRRYAIDSSKARRELGWTPRYTFEAGLRATVAWYLEHTAWCEAVQSGRYGRERLGVLK